jgi:hypothetical protein
LWFRCIATLPIPKAARLKPRPTCTFARSNQVFIDGAIAVVVDVITLFDLWGFRSVTQQVATITIERAILAYAHVSKTASITLTNGAIIDDTIAVIVHGVADLHSG